MYKELKVITTTDYIETVEKYLEKREEVNVLVYHSYDKSVCVGKINYDGYRGIEFRFNASTVSQLSNTSAIILPNAFILIKDGDCDHPIKQRFLEFMLYPYLKY